MHKITMQDIYENLRDQLNRSEINLMAITRSTGIAYNTLLSIKSGTANPTLITMNAIHSFIWSKKDGVSCADCEFCLDRNIEQSSYGCEIAMGGSDEDPISCQMFKPAR